ncbi:MAG: hypothetical protein Rubg2KO_30540 [Rubricoccaceae bacterium]
MTRSLSVATLVAGLALVTTLPASAQITLARATVSSGVTNATGGSLSLRATIGLPAVGTVSGGSLSLCQGFWCDAGLPADLELALTLALQGAYDTGAGDHRTLLADGGLLPTAQPYASSAYDGTPLAYDGTETVASVPATAVDWILVELRTTTAATDSVTAAAALLQEDGTATLTFPGLSAGSYYVVTRHRNHIPAISASAVALSGSGGTLDLTAPGAATSGVVEVTSGVWALWAADGSLDGLVTAPDFNVYSSASASGATGYRVEDYTMDGLVTAPDFNLYNANAAAGAATAVPEN